jgi:hypothetical protein
VPYDHQANTNERFGWRKADCSGGVSRSYEDGAGMTRGQDGVGTVSSTFALYGEKHPDRLLWKKGGGGYFSDLRQALAIVGAVWVLGGTTGIGDNGHTGLSTGQPDGQGGFVTIESASSLGGVAFGSTTRFRPGTKHEITHVVLMPGITYDAILEEDTLSAAAEAKLDRLQVDVAKIRDALFAPNEDVAPTILTNLEGRSIEVWQALFRPDLLKARNLASTLVDIHEIVIPVARQAKAVLDVIAPYDAAAKAYRATAKFLGVFK